MKYTKPFKKLRGSDLLEYAFLMVLVSLTTFLCGSELSTNLSHIFDRVSTVLDGQVRSMTTALPHGYMRAHIMVIMRTLVVGGIIILIFLRRKVWR